MYSYTCNSISFTELPFLIANTYQMYTIVYLVFDQSCEALVV